MLQHLEPYVTQIIREHFATGISGGSVVINDITYLRDGNAPPIGVKHVDVQTDAATVSQVFNDLSIEFLCQTTVLVSEAPRSDLNAKLDLLNFGASLMRAFALNDSITPTSDPVGDVTRDDLSMVLVKDQVRLSVPLLDTDSQAIRMLIDLPVLMRIGDSVWEPSSPDFDQAHTFGSPIMTSPLRNFYLRLETGNASEQHTVFEE